MGRTGNQRMERLAQSEIRAMTQACAHVQGISALPAQGVCDTEFPPVVARGAQQAIDEGINIYTRYDGRPG
ncbi:MAG: hypothetical protein U0361_14595 [Nitrospiraceae bacterium]